MAELPKPLDRTRNHRSEPKANILLVDDNAANLLSLRAILDELGHNLVEAHSGEEALERVLSDEFAVVLLDVHMPGISGFETAKLIRGRNRSRHIPIIFLTANDIDRSQIEEGYALGAVDFLVKPIMPVVLQAKVRGLVEIVQDKQRARREAEQLRLLVQGTTEYAIFMLDPEGYILTWNSGAERLKGYKAEEIVGQHFSRFYPQDAIDRGWPAHELQVAEADGRFEDEGWRVRKDGTQFWANVVLTALRDEHGDLRGFSKVTRDLTARKQTEEALRRSEERFRLLVEGAKDHAIFLLDPQGYVASWNAGAERINQYRAEEIIGQHFSRFYPQEAIDRDWPAHELKVALKEGRFEDEGWRVRKDGTTFWANVVITALRDEAGNHRGFSKITRDMTDRKHAEENSRRLVEEAAARRVAEENARIIQEQRERLHVTLASIGDAVISTDAEGRITFLNLVAQELVGWKSEDAINRNLSDVFHIVNEQTRQPVENPAMRALMEGKIVGLANHTVLIAKDGTERPIDDSAAPIRDAEGKIIGSVLVFRDISERKRAEEALREAERRWRSLAEALPNLVWTDLPDGQCDYLSSQWGSYTGIPEKELLGLAWLERVIHPDDRERTLACWTAAVEDKGEFDLEYRIRRHDGQYRWFKTRGVPIRDESGRIIYWFGTCTDIEDYKRAEEALREADRRKDEFLATLAHELRNPLAPIRNSLQILKMPRVDAATVQQTREMMERQVHHLVRLVDDLLDVSRVMRGKIELRREPVELATIVARAVETAKPLIEVQGHQLDISVSPESLLLDADPIRLAQVVGNLLTNSAKYSEGHGHIWLTAERENGQAVLKVRDSGIGIAPDMLPHVFELFVQADHASTKAQGGLCIGLTLVKNLVEMHDGSVEAHSAGLGKGCEFVIRLPIKAEERRESSEKESGLQQPERSPSGHRLLVVDDNKDAAMSLATLLRLQGHEVRIADNGSLALEMANSYRPDLVFLDIGMPGMDGYEVARRMRQMPGLEKTVLTALTGWGQQEDRRRTAKAGFDHHLVKPVEATALENLLAGLKRPADR